MDVVEEEVDEWMDNTGDGADSNGLAGDSDRSALALDGSNGVPEESTAALNVHGLDTPGIADTPSAASLYAQASGDVRDSSVDQSSSPTQSSGLFARRQASNAAFQDTNTASGVNIAAPGQSREGTNRVGSLDVTSNTDIADIVSGEGLLTPRNDAGPFVFDGGGGQSSLQRPIIISSP